MTNIFSTRFILLVLTLVMLGGAVQYAFATAAESASGWAWGGNDADGLSNTGDENGFGWISFNSTDCDANDDNLIDNASCGTIGNAIPDYGVNIPDDDGNALTDEFLSGYAWSEHYGWISFEGFELVGMNACAPVLAQAARVGNALTGGARISAVRNAIGSGNAGGFDGCISLSGTAVDGSSYGVTIDPVTGSLGGYAWSSDLGWINFGGDGGNVTVAATNATDLTFQNFTHSAGPYSVGTPINLSAEVVNNGTLPTATGFSNNFSYSTDGGANWTEITAFSHPTPVAVGNTESDADTYTPTAAGNLLLQYCVDSNMVNVYGEIDEGAGEGNNCQQLPAITVTATPPSVDISVSVCTIPAGNNDCISPLTTWIFSDATPDYKIWSGTTGDIYTGPNGNSSAGGVRLEHGPNTIYGYHNNDFALGQEVDSITFLVGCVGSAQLSAVTTNCELPPTFTVTATPNLIRYDSSTSVTITNTSASPLTCDVYGANSTPDMGIPLAPGASQLLPTKNIRAKQQVLVECLDSGTGLTGTTETYIEVLPKIQEV